MTGTDPAYAGPWPDGRRVLEREASAYLEDAADPALQGRPTICEPWTVRDVTKHLAATFRRFNLMLARSRAGDFSKPFEPGDLDDENRRAVEAFMGDPNAALADEVAGFVARATDLEEPMAHQRGVIPVGLQVLFGLTDVVIHHWDLARATGRSARPGSDALALVVPALGALGAGDPRGDRWEWILRAAGRPV